MADEKVGTPSGAEYFDRSWYDRLRRYDPRLRPDVLSWTISGYERFGPFRKRFGLWGSKAGDAFPKAVICQDVFDA